MESYLNHSVYCRNAEDGDSIFGASWEQQRSNLWSFNGGINCIDPHIDRMSVLAITRIIARLSQTIAHRSYQTEMWRDLCASHVGTSAVSCQNSCVTGCGTVSTDTGIGPTLVVRTYELGIGTSCDDRRLQRRRANHHRERLEGIGRL